MDYLEDAFAELAEVDYMLFTLVELADELQSSAVEYDAGRATADGTASELSRVIGSLNGLGFMTQNKLKTVSDLLYKLDDERLKGTALQSKVPASA